jgi:hypothetical protein
MRWVAVLKSGMRNESFSLCRVLEQMRRHAERATRAQHHDRGEPLYFAWSCAGVRGCNCARAEMHARGSRDHTGVMWSKKV